MRIRSRPVRGGLAPGTDPVTLGLITAMVLVSLVMTAVTARGRLLPGAAAAGGPGPGVTATAVRRPQSAAPGQSAALGLLLKAARASRLAPYQGAEALDWWGAAGEDTVTVEVWHQPGGEALTTMAAPGPGLAQDLFRWAPGQAADPRPTLANGMVLGMSTQLAGLLGANYALAVTGRGVVAGRPASVVTVRGRGGGLAAKFWVDGATYLPLRRQTFDERSRKMISDVRFWWIRLGRGAVASAPAPAARAWGDTLAPAQLARLRAEGWPLPGPMPSHLRLVSARENATASGRVVDLDYSDGLSLISIFVQRGHLAQLAGWSQVALRGHRVYSDDPDDLTVAWSAQGYVYTMISAAPTQTVGQVVAALPHGSRPGVLTRIRRGLARLLSWVSP